MELCRLNPVLNCCWRSRHRNNKGPLTLSEKSFHLCFSSQAHPEVSFFSFPGNQPVDQPAHWCMLCLEMCDDSRIQDSGRSFPHTYIELGSAFLFLTRTVPVSQGYEEQAALRRTTPSHSTNNRESSWSTSKKSYLAGCVSRLRRQIGGFFMSGLHKTLFMN